jgi:hypothetical protein
MSQEDDVVFRDVRWIIVLLMLFAVCSSVSAYKKIKVFMPQPPEVSLSGVKQIAVLDFKPGAGTSKEAGKYIADKIIEHLLTENRGIYDFQGGLLNSSFQGTTLMQGISTKCFSVVERSRLESVLKEQSMSADGLVDDAQAVEVGRILGVEILLYGDISVGAQDNTTYETRVSLSGKIGRAHV